VVTAGVQGTINTLEANIILYNAALQQGNEDALDEHEENIKEGLEDLGIVIDQLKIDQASLTIPYSARTKLEALDALRYTVDKTFVRDWKTQDSSGFVAALKTGFNTWWDGISTNSNVELDPETALLVDEPNSKARFYFIGNRAPTTTTITPQTVENSLQKFLNNNPHRVGDVLIYTPGPLFSRP